MNHVHRRFLELAAVSIDFELSRAEREELAAHLSICDSCTRALDEMRADARLMRGLPTRELALERSPVILRRALRRGPDLASLRLIAVAAILALLLVGVVVAGSELLRSMEAPVLPRATTSLPPSEVPSLPPPPPGAWLPVGSLSVARGGHTATRLPDGRVLVTGGTNAEGDLASVEIYDLETRTWSAGAPLNDARSGHVAVTLPDGSVLEISGYGGPEGPLASSERFFLDDWTPGPGLENGRVAFAAVAIDGGVLAIGGMFGEGIPRSEVELWDGVAGRAFTNTAPLSTPRVRHTATVLADGNVLVIGGLGPGGDQPLASAEVFDVAAKDWRPVAAMDIARYDHTATLLPDGRVLVVGGVGVAGQRHSSVTIYDPATDSWTKQMDLADARSGHGAAVVENGNVVVVGGFGDPDAIASTELLDVRTSTWQESGSLQRPRRQVVLVQLLDGSLLVVGGEPSKGGETTDVELRSGTAGS